MKDLITTSIKGASFTFSNDIYQQERLRCNGISFRTSSYRNYDG